MQTDPERGLLRRWANLACSSPWVELVGVALGIGTGWYLRQTGTTKVLQRQRQLELEPRTTLPATGEETINGVDVRDDLREGSTLPERLARGLPVLGATWLWQVLNRLDGPPSLLDPLAAILAWFFFEVILVSIPHTLWTYWGLARQAAEVTVTAEAQQCRALPLPLPTPEPTDSVPLHVPVDEGLGRENYIEEVAPLTPVRAKAESGATGSSVTCSARRRRRPAASTTAEGRVTEPEDAVPRWPAASADEERKGNGEEVGEREAGDGKRASDATATKTYTCVKGPKVAPTAEESKSTPGASPLGSDPAQIDGDDPVIEGTRRAEIDEGACASVTSSGCARDHPGVSSAVASGVSSAVALTARTPSVKRRLRHQIGLGGIDASNAGATSSCPADSCGRCTTPRLLPPPHSAFPESPSVAANHEATPHPTSSGHAASHFVIQRPTSARHNHETVAAGPEAEGVSAPHTADANPAHGGSRRRPRRLSRQRQTNTAGPTRAAGEGEVSLLPLNGDGTAGSGTVSFKRPHSLSVGSACTPVSPPATTAIARAAKKGKQTMTDEGLSSAVVAAKSSERLCEQEGRRKESGTKDGVDATTGVDSERRCLEAQGTIPGARVSSAFEVVSTCGEGTDAGGEVETEEQGKEGVTGWRGRGESSIHGDCDSEEEEAACGERVNVGGEAETEEQGRRQEGVAGWRGRGESLIPGDFDGEEEEPTCGERVDAGREVETEEQGKGQKGVTRWRGRAESSIPGDFGGEEEEPTGGERIHAGGEVETEEQGKGQEGVARLRGCGEFLVPGDIDGEEKEPTYGERVNAGGEGEIEEQGKGQEGVARWRGRGESLVPGGFDGEEEGPTCEERVNAGGEAETEEQGKEQEGVAAWRERAESFILDDFNGEEKGTPVPPELRPPGREHDVLCEWSLSHLRKDDEIGMFARGAFGKVAAVRTKNGVPIAAKVVERSALSPERYIERELELLKRCSVHPHVVDLLGVIRTEQRVYVLMPLADTDLAAMIKSTRLDEKQIGFCVRQVLSALEFMHGRRVVHRDIKPANILVLSNKLLLADFGLAKDIPRGKRPEMVGACGTKAYMAPELVRDLPYDESVDLWAVGVVTFEMLHGYTPFVPTLAVARSWDGVVREEHPKIGANGDGRDVASVSVSESSGSIVNRRMFERSSPAAPGGGLERAWVAGQAHEALLFGEEDEGGTVDFGGGYAWRGRGRGRRGHREADQLRLLDNIVRGKYRVRGDRVGKTAADFIRQLLQTTPARRMSAVQAAEHPFLGRPSKVPTRRRTTRVEVAVNTAERASRAAEQHKARFQSLSLGFGDGQAALAVEGNAAVATTAAALSEIANLAMAMAAEVRAAQADAKRWEAMAAEAEAKAGARGEGTAGELGPAPGLSMVDEAVSRVEAAVQRAELFGREAQAGEAAAAAAAESVMAATAVEDTDDGDAGRAAENNAMGRGKGAAAAAMASSPEIRDPRSRHRRWAPRRR